MICLHALAPSMPSRVANYFELVHIAAPASNHQEQIEIQHLQKKNVTKNDAKKKKIFDTNDKK
jgi:hypothetical protein